MNLFSSILQYFTNDFILAITFAGSFVYILSIISFAVVYSLFYFYFNCYLILWQYAFNYNLFCYLSKSILFWHGASVQQINCYIGMTSQSYGDLFKHNEKYILRLVNFSIDFVMSADPPYECIIKCGFLPYFMFLFKSLNIFNISPWALTQWIVAGRPKLIARYI